MTNEAGQSDTPRTDELYRKKYPGCRNYWTPYLDMLVLARQLERKLAQTQRERKEAREDGFRWRAAYNSAREDLFAALKRAEAAERRVAERENALRVVHNVVCGIARPDLPSEGRDPEAMAALAVLDEAMRATESSQATVATTSEAQMNERGGSPDDGDAKMEKFV